MKKSNVYLLVATANDASISFFGSQLVEIIDEQEKHITTIVNSGNLERFAQEIYSHSLFIVSNIEKIPFHLRLQYLNFAVLCCLYVVDRHEHSKLRNKSLTRNINDVLEQLTLLIDDCQ